MFVIEGCGTNETPQLGYLGGLVILGVSQRRQGAGT